MKKFLVMSWREKREHGWGDTVYVGIKTKIRNDDVLIAILSHGMRVFQYQGSSNYGLVQAPLEIEVSDRDYNEFIAAAERVYVEDKAFQAYSAWFKEKVMFWE